MPPTRRRKQSPHFYAIEPAPQPAPSGDWLAAVSKAPIVAVLTFIITGAGFYALTNYRLDKQEQAQPAVSARLDEERREREKVRDAFLASQAKTTDILGQISSRLAISETKQEATNKALDASNLTLNKIADQLQQLNAGRAARGH